MNTDGMKCGFEMFKILCFFVNSIIGMLIRKRLQQDTPQSDRRAREQEAAVSQAAAKEVSAS